MKRYRQLYVYVALSLLLTVFVFLIDRDAQQHLLNLQIEQCESTNDVLRKSNERFKLQRQFAIAVEELMAERASIDQSFDPDISRLDRQLVVKTREFRLATTDYEQIDCGK